MMNVVKIRSFCRIVRVSIGAGLVGYALGSGNWWFYLGILPLAAGILNFCPLCLITKQCDINEN